MGCEASMWGVTIQSGPKVPASQRLKVVWYMLTFSRLIKKKYLDSKCGNKIEGKEHEFESGKQGLHLRSFEKVTHDPRACFLPQAEF